MSAPKLLGIYTARFPYLEASRDKIRPVIVMSKPYGEFGVVAIVPISSKTTLQAVDIKLSEWKSSGLAKVSIARVHRLTTMLQSDLIAELGQVGGRDAKALKASVQAFLNL